MNVLDIVRAEVRRELGGGNRKRVPPLFVLGKIDPAYTSGRPKVVFDDDTSQTATGPYPYVSSYTPAADDRVLLARVGVSGKYVILGKIV